MAADTASGPDAVRVVGHRSQRPVLPGKAGGAVMQRKGPGGSAGGARRRQRAPKCSQVSGGPEHGRPRLTPELFFGSRGLLAGPGRPPQL